MIFDERIVGTRHVHLKWYAKPDEDGIHPGVAMEYWTFFFQIEKGNCTALIGAPHETMLQVPYQAGGEYWGVLLKAHLFMPWLAKRSIPRQGRELPVLNNKYLLINGQEIPMPTYQKAEDFVEELIKRDIIATHPLVEKALSGQPTTSERTMQRHMLQIAGLTRRELERIRRARHAYALLQAGKTIPDVVVEADYVDQAHLTKSLKLLAGQTPGQILAAYKNQL